MQTQSFKHEGGTLSLFKNSSPAKKTAGKVSELDLNEYLTRVQEKVNQDYAHSFKGVAPKIGIMKGRTYARLVVVRDGRPTQAFGFVELGTGNVLKASGWSAPAKNFARGNIFDVEGGVKRVFWTGVQ